MRGMVLSGWAGVGVLIASLVPAAASAQGASRIALAKGLAKAHIPMETKALLADRVRERVPDLPFANPNGGGSTSMASGPDPCSVITRADAEAVLGPLVVEPFGIGEAEPFPDAGGTSCGYFTPNHHMLIVTPYWSDGKSELGIRRGVGKLISMAAPDAEAAAADTLEGSWDEAAKDLDGSLLFLKGDRLLRLSFATSSANAVQALRLAGKGVDRLASASPR